MYIYCTASQVTLQLRLFYHYLISCTSNLVELINQLITSAELTTAIS